MLRNPIFYDFSGGYGPPVPPSGSALELDDRANLKERVVARSQSARYLCFQLVSSVVECLTRDRGAPGLSLIGVTVLCP